MSDISSVYYAIYENLDVLTSSHGYDNMQVVAPTVSVVPSGTTANQRRRNRNNIRRHDFALDEKTRLLHRFNRGCNRVIAKIESKMSLNDLNEVEKAEVLQFMEMIKSSCEKSIKKVSNDGEAEYMVKKIHKIRCSRMDNRLRAYTEYVGYPLEKDFEWILISNAGNLGPLNDYFKNLPTSSPLKRLLYTE